MSPSVLDQFSAELESLVQRVAPGVVALEHPRGHGTGVVLAPDGYLLTNAHVARGASRLRVRFSDGARSVARVVGSDGPSDLAVLRADHGSLSSLPLANASDVRVGQLVLAIGHPYGFERSVSLGVVSALGRRLSGRDGTLLDGLLQTDAAINPGNSGGPLVNARGAVVGINTAMLPFAQGIGFAVPSSTVSWVAALLLQHGEVRRKYLGIAARNEDLPAELAAEVGRNSAVRVLDIGPGSPAAGGGLSAQDLLLAVNGAEVRSIDDLQRLMATEASGQVELELWRKDGRRRATVRPTLRTAA